ncbi:MAG: hypothetical protein ACREQ7_22425 [Candidatus Binatia bacterium]
MAADEPEINVEQVHKGRGDKADSWLSAWRIENLGDTSIEIVSARLPHGKFRSKDLRFSPSISVPARGGAVVNAAVAFNEAPGTIVENAFLILLIECLQVRWRVFVRFRVTANQAAEPETLTELITTQKVGFSAAPGERK